MGATEPARETDDGVLMGSGAAGGRIDHPNRAVSMDVSEGSTRRGMALDTDCPVGVVGSSSRTEEDGKDTELMIDTNDCT